MSPRLPGVLEHLPAVAGQGAELLQGGLAPAVEPLLGEGSLAQAKHGFVVGCEFVPLHFLAPLVEALSRLPPPLRERLHLGRGGRRELVVVWAREPIGLEGLMQQYKYPTEQEMGGMGPSSETPAL